MSSVIDSIERRQQRPGLPPFEAGDRVRVHFKVIEGSRERTQVFEGVVIKRQGAGARETFTVRKKSFGVGVERTFPLHSPKIDRLEVAARGAVRRAKLYYLRGRVGKAARVAERRWGIDESMVSTSTGGEEAVATDAEGATQSEVAAEAAPLEGDASTAEAEGASSEAEGETGTEAEAAAEPAAGADEGDGADTDAEAAGAGETEDSTATEDAEEESPDESGDSGKDSA